MKKWDIIKTIIYPIFAIIIFIFHESFIGYLSYLVSSIMLLYSIEGIIKSIIKRDLLNHMTSFYGDFLVFILGLVLLIFINDETQFESVAVIWGTWVILRESKELFEATETIFKKGYGLFNISESIIVIIYSILLIINPIEHHVHAHIILLGIELILDVLFPIINKRIEISINRIKEKRNQKL